MDEGAVRLYADNPTKNGTDGRDISESTQEFPLSVIVNTKSANHTIVKAALRCDLGFRTTGSTEIEFAGNTATKWQIADDDNFVDEEMAEYATYHESLSIDDVIGDKNHIVWLKVSSGVDEEAQVDTSVKIRIHGNTVPA